MGIILGEDIKKKNLLKSSFQMKELQIIETMKMMATRDE